MTKSFVSPISLFATGLLAACIVPATASAKPIALKASLDGASASPAGDPDGVGGFSVEVDPDTNDFCYTLWVEKTAAPTMAHVHAGVAGATGGPVITLEVTGKDDNICIAVDKAKLDPIVATPAGYYVNVHTADFPGGAVRGQLTK